MKTMNLLAGAFLVLALSSCNREPSRQDTVVGTDSDTSTITMTNTNTATATSTDPVNVSPVMPDNSGGSNSNDSSRSGGSNH